MRVIIYIYNEKNINITKKKNLEGIPMSKALDIAYFLLALSGERGITNLKLQKMLYFIQKEMVRRFDRLAYVDTIEAWQYGPVVPSIYYEFSSYGSSPIVLLDKNIKNLNDSDVEDISRIIFDENIERNVWDLVNETHVQGSAWANAFHRGYREPITFNDIRAEERNNV